VFGFVARNGQADGDVSVSSEIIVEGAGGMALTALGDGEAARVTGLREDSSAMGKLKAMGIMPGAVIEKKSSSLNKGPVVVVRGATQLALAYSIAQGILVELL
jgi:Fe2+ transport system protein FeoA